MRKPFIVSLLCVLAGLSACSKTYPPTTAVKIGKPYNVMGKTYAPGINIHYDETGIASWYGPGFNGHRTASGETYDQSKMTAAHTTLPMPSLVRVTNLDNGKQAIVRVNDRGPYHTNRIIDLSKAAAEALGVIGTGTAHVRVQYLKTETVSYLEENKIAGREVIIAADTTPLPEAEVPIEVAEAEPKKRSWNLINDADAADAPPQGAIAGSSVSSQELPPIRPVYKTEMNKDSSAPILSTYKSPNSTNAPFAAPENTQTAPLPALTQSNSPSLLKAMEKVEDVGVSVSDSVPAAPTPPAAPGASMYVQAGSFGVKQNADALAARLQNVGAQVSETASSGKTIYRVRTGPLASEGDAQDILARLSSMGLHGTIIRP